MNFAAQRLRDIQSFTNLYMVDREDLYVFPIADTEPAGLTLTNQGLGNTTPHSYGAPPPDFSLGFTIITRTNPLDLCDISNPPPTIQRSPLPDVSLLQQALASATGFFQTWCCGSCPFTMTEMPILPYELSFPRPRPSTTVAPEHKATREQMIREYHPIVPLALHHHLIIMIPPMTTIFPRMYPEVIPSTH